MDKNTRTYKAIKNAIISLICEILYIVSRFVCRTVFTKILGAEYLGVNGLFTNILQLLSFVELGMGSALIYMMYKPIAENNENELLACVLFYKKIYRFISIFITLAGICVCPFIKYLVYAPEITKNILFIYLLFLANTVTSYLFVAEKSIFSADQKDYVVSLFTQASYIVMDISQIVILIFTKNFYLYLGVGVTCSLLNNLICSIYARKCYPFLKTKEKHYLPKKDVNEFKSNVKGLFLTKIAATSFQGTDNIFISLFAGISKVGIFSNYVLITTIINNLLNKIFNSITPTIGNFSVSSLAAEKKVIFDRLYYTNIFLYRYICLGLALFFTQFVTKIWLDNSFLLSEVTIFLIVIELYLRGEHYIVNIFRNANGDFSQLKSFYVIAAILNVIFDIVLGKTLGLDGIIIATIAGRFICRIADVIVVFKEELNIEPVKYFTKHYLFLLFYVIEFFLFFILFKFISLPNVYIDFLLKILIFSVLYVIIELIFFRKNQKYLLSIVRNVFRK